MNYKDAQVIRNILEFFLRCFGSSDNNATCPLTCKSDRQSKASNSWLLVIAQIAYKGTDSHGFFQNHMHVLEIIPLSCLIPRHSSVDLNLTVRLSLLSSTLSKRAILTWRLQSGVGLKATEAACCRTAARRS